MGYSAGEASDRLGRDCSQLHSMNAAWYRLEYRGRIAA
jgi:hypothetical protein